jgi:hypothetical protein
LDGARLFVRLGVAATIRYAGPMGDDWRHYPHVPTWGDPAHFTFPAVDGCRRDLGISTYYMDGFLRAPGGSTPRWAFIVILTDMWVLGRRVRASFYTAALFDLERGDYGTYTDYDFPRPLRRRRAYKLTGAPDHLDLSYDADAGLARWAHARCPDGTLDPFAWALRLPGRDHRGRPFLLELDVRATRPPAPLGGPALGGAMMFLGAPVTYSYFQSGLDMQGHLRWGDVHTPVDGRIGWIDRQWADDDFTRHQDWRSTRYRHEWRVMHFDDGWDMSLFRQYLRPAHAAVVPWSGLSAQGPGPEHALRAATDVEVRVPEFIRSPGVVRAMSMLTDGPRWFPHRHAVRVPAWEMDVRSDPLVPAPAHGLPIEYWTGPVRLQGTLWGRPVTGHGFDERSRPWVHDFELAQALRESVRHLEDVDTDAAWLLGYRCWEVEALARRRDRRRARRHFRERVLPLLGALPPGARSRLAPLATDLQMLLARSPAWRLGR